MFHKLITIQLHPYFTIYQAKLPFLALNLNLFVQRTKFEMLTYFYLGLVSILQFLTIIPVHSLNLHKTQLYGQVGFPNLLQNQQLQSQKSYVTLIKSFLPLFLVPFLRLQVINNQLIKTYQIH